MTITNEQLIDILQSDIIIDADGTKRWYLDGKKHRVDGPAIIHPDGYTEWYLNGELHRTDGPAIEFSNIKRWFLNGLRYSEEDYKKKIADFG